RKRILDKKIPHQYVRIRDESTREVGPLTPLSTVLSNINKVDERVELILSEPEPIVRVISKGKLKELHKQDKAAVKPKRTYPPKEIQITWSIEREDLERKLDKVKKELDRNVTVELVIGRKKGMPIPSPGEKMEKMDVIAEMLKLFGRE
ncbi:uncharacterized protein EI90DRAFT_2883472, partial [Cantharellus anzutake]|uniref:uncharacterized protein n=1 Tax=Cantharellus anzutake TaxID=1750568 RepID=UPI001903192B